MGIHCVSGLEKPPNIDIWDIDETCKPHLPVLQKAYNDVAVMAAKALEDIQFVQQPRPQYNTRSNKRMQWDRIARAMKCMFGFMPGEQGTDKYMARVLYVYQTMNEALRGDHNLPKDGFTKRHNKALWLCDDKLWKWHHSGMSDPNNPSLLPLFQSREDIMKGKKGVWIYRDRYITNDDSRSPGICGPDSHAKTHVKYDMITFCPTSFTGKVAKAESPVDGKNGVVVGKNLDEFGRYSLSRIMFHELVHWYGSKGVERQKRLIDQQAVSKTGQLMWFRKNGERFEKEAAPERPDKSWNALNTYYFGWVEMLARRYDGAVAQNSGPGKATETAEAYAYFAMMAYLDNFDWAVDGLAKHMEL
ncbi:uncharacterized protein TRIVIDRAFT_161046 [Trichoderma virens Gv29-8]|uniref:Lysine-specific metallo-endopeptidase domain-containing protein n=1 Tax=Hypocrea virens (strain Gv29-8 / FGSC 10586) TaxID=413071 RepID=G9N810_HYPVG|nr:uncharacterized protein TRIVIDRAFT_161046 [Trichoderma virens Gv29-8]EHK17122.1 hypothetical protein TRIVIDRAFT_161046 [Trichoderma virens Gv29-8]